jgi:hypothetical protein
VKKFFRHVLDVLFPDPKTKHCPHCGGGKCFGLCGIQGEQPDAQTGQDNAKVEEQGRPAE